MLKYYYQYTDNLENVHLSYTDADKNSSISQSEIVEESNYYPFGLKHRGYNNIVLPLASNYKYKYNNKELQTELDWYDYGARFYDAELGRWTTIDPLAEKKPFNTSYHFLSNNPINRIDPDGKDDYYINKKGRIVKRTQNKKADNIYIVNKKGVRVKGKTIKTKFSGNKYIKKIYNSVVDYINSAIQKENNEKKIKKNESK